MTKHASGRPAAPESAPARSLEQEILELLAIRPMTAGEITSMHLTNTRKAERDQAIAGLFEQGLIEQVEVPGRILMIQLLQLTGRNNGR
jgi:hypothetical protein